MTSRQHAQTHGDRGRETASEPAAKEARLRGARQARGTTECFVFVYLPGATSPVVCGRFAQSVTTDGQRVGRYTYGTSYLKHAGRVALDPGGLPVRQGTFPPVTAMGGVYGVLRDAGPDAWGRVVIERARGARSPLPEIDYLLASGNDRIGALAFGTLPDAPIPARGHHKAVELKALLEAAALVEQEVEGTPAVQQAAELLLYGVTMGGARPKAVIEEDGTAWIAKFPARADRYNMAAVEAGLLRLAADCGMTVPNVRTERVGGKPVLLVQRFDRRRIGSEVTRARYLSALTILDADETPSPAWSYVALAEQLRRRSAKPDADRSELFRRMVFNALVSNNDDHPRNHAMLCWREEQWLLSPLFDVVPAGNPASFERDLALALTVGKYGRSARRANLVSEAEVFGLGTSEAEAIITQLKAKVLEGWEERLRGFGATASDLDAVRHAIVPAAFEEPPPGMRPGSPR